MRYLGGCHCGAVRFVVEAPKKLEVERCNCSICVKAGFLHLIVPAQHFELLSGNDVLTEYRFNTGVARHYFCSRCGVKAFYIPRSNPDGVDINVNCLDTQPADMSIVEFDGQNWEANAHRLAHKSHITD
ncbi:MAG: GFA family protein [Pseudomonadota bacterium]